MESLRDSAFDCFCLSVLQLGVKTCRQDSLVLSHNLCLFSFLFREIMSFLTPITQNQQKGKHLRSNLVTNGYRS